MSSASSSRYSPATRTLDQLSVNEAQQQLEQFVKEIRTSSVSSREGLDEVEKALLADFVAAASVTPTPPQPILEEVTPFILPPPSSLLSPQVMRQFRYDSYDEVMSMASPVGRLHHEESQKPRNASFATIASVQLEDSVFDCEWDSCTEAFRSLDDLCKHLQHDHLARTQVPFHCMWRSCERHPHATTLSQGIKTSAIIDECTQTPFRPFPKRNKLVMHVRTHTGERPFKCEECGRGFARADGLASHRKRHEQRATARGHVRGASGDAAEALLNSPQCVIGGVGVWACRVCARRFTTLVAARRHEAQAHAETEALGGEVDELVGVIPVQDMLYGHGLQPMMAPHNPTPPVNNWYGGAPAPGLDDSAWWAVAAERHFQSVVQGQKNPHASAKDQFLTPPSL